MKDTNSEMDVLDKFNISAFCDEWGPEKVMDFQKIIPHEERGPRPLQKKKSFAQCS